MKKTLLVITLGLCAGISYGAARSTELYELDGSTLPIRLSAEELEKRLQLILQASSATSSDRNFNYAIDLIGRAHLAAQDKNINAASNYLNIAQNLSAWFIHASPEMAYLNYLLETATSSAYAPEKIHGILPQPETSERAIPAQSAPPVLGLEKYENDLYLTWVKSTPRMVIASYLNHFLNLPEIRFPNDPSVKDVANVLSQAFTLANTTRQRQDVINLVARAFTLPGAQAIVWDNHGKPITILELFTRTIEQSMRDDEQ